MKSIYETSKIQNLMDQADAIVLSSKKDHKFIFLKNNPNTPKNLIPDKKRTKGKVYQKGNIKLYPVVVDMFEHPSIISGDRDLADIWIVDSLEQAQEQLNLMIKHGAKQFNSKIQLKKG